MDFALQGPDRKIAALIELFGYGADELEILYE